MDGLRLGSSTSTFHKQKMWIWFGFGWKMVFGWMLSYRGGPCGSVEGVMAGKSLAMWTGKSSGTLLGKALFSE